MISKRPDVHTWYTCWELLHSIPLVPTWEKVCNMRRGHLCTPEVVWCMCKRFQTKRCWSILHSNTKIAPRALSFSTMWVASCQFLEQQGVFSTSSFASFKHWWMPLFPWWSWSSRQHRISPASHQRSYSQTSSLHLFMHPHPLMQHPKTYHGPTFIQMIHFGLMAKTLSMPSAC